MGSSTDTWERRGIAAVWRWAVVAALAALLAAGAARPAWADAPGRVGRLAETQGRVWIHDTERGGWDDALRNRPVTTGDRIATDDGARATVQVGSATLRLGGASEVEWVEVDDDVVRVRLLSGSAALRVFSADVAHEFQLLTPHGRVLPLFAGHYRVDLLADATVVEALQGEAVFDADDSRKTVASGQRLAFWQRGERGRTQYDVVTTPLDEFGRWLLAVQRDEQRAWAATRYVSPETTGWEDLDRHGRWERHPDYGTIWVPLAVAPDWAPYRYGRWTWVSPWGWTWVDDAPWGFAPFHYGRWVWWGGRWAWWPGSYVRRPVYAPALVGWIGGGNVSIGISIGSGPWVGWVPLSPYDDYRPWYKPRRAPVHVPPPRPVPRERASGYVYLNVPGSVTVVGRQTFEQRRPIGPSEWRRVDPDDWRRAGRLPAVGSAPPPPAAVAPGRPVVPTPPPRPPRGDRDDRGDRGDRGDRDARNDRGGPSDRGNRDERSDRDDRNGPPRDVPPPARPGARDDDDRGRPPLTGAPGRDGERVPPGRLDLRDRDEPRDRDEVRRPLPVGSPHRPRGAASDPALRPDLRDRGEPPRPPVASPAVRPLPNGRDDLVPPGRQGLPPRQDGAGRPDRVERADRGDRMPPPYDRGDRGDRNDRLERGGRPDAPPFGRAMPPEAGRGPAMAPNPAPDPFARERAQPVPLGGRDVRESREPRGGDADDPQARRPGGVDPRAVAR